MLHRFTRLKERRISRTLPEELLAEQLSSPLPSPPQVH